MDTVRILVTRDARTKGPYDHQQDFAEFGGYPNEYCDIPVDVEIESRYAGTKRLFGHAVIDDDPPEVTLGKAKVAEDCPIYDDLGKPIAGQFLFRKGDPIELTSSEESDAETEALKS